MHRQAFVRSIRPLPPNRSWKKEKSQKEPPYLQDENDAEQCRYYENTRMETDDSARARSRGRRNARRRKGSRRGSIITVVRILLHISIRTLFSNNTLCRFGSRSGLGSRSHQKPLIIIRFRRRGVSASSRNRNNGQEPFHVIGGNYLVGVTASRWRSRGRDCWR